MKINKKIIIVLILLVALFAIQPVHAVNIKGCTTALSGVKIDVKIANAVHLIITILKVAVPIILVIFAMIDLVKSITSNDEKEIEKHRNILIKRAISAVLIFFIVSLVQLVVSLAAGDKEGTSIMNCANCFINGADEDSGRCN